MKPFNINIDCELGELSESAIYSVEVIQECYCAINEGAGDENVLKVAQKYTKSLLTYVLDVAQQILSKMVASMIKAFHNYIINGVRVAKKFKEIVIQKMQKLDPISYSYYTYPGLYEYPIPLKQSVASTREIIDLFKTVKKNEGHGTITLEEFVDKKIKEFSKEVLGKPINPADINAYTTEVANQVIRGTGITRTVSKANITKFYEDLENTVKEKKKIYAIRNEINEYYKELRKEIDAIYKNDESPNPAATDKNPNFRQTKVHMNNIDGTVTRIEMQRNRLLNSYIQIYRAAFTAKINIIKEKIDIDSRVIALICRKSSIFATLSGH